MGDGLKERGDHLLSSPEKRGSLERGPIWVRRLHGGFHDRNNKGG